MNPTESARESEPSAVVDGAQPILSSISRRTKLATLTRRLEQPCRILEVGPGDGWFTTRLRQLGHKVVTIDVEPGIADLTGDIKQWRELGLEAASFDVIVALEVIEHVDCIAELHDLCRPGGFVFLSSPHPRFDWVMRILESVGLTQKRTSPHSNLTDFKADFKTVPLVQVVLRRPLGIHQVGLFQRPPT